MSGDVMTSPRHVSARMVFAILLLPMIFGWLTLRRGYSSRTRLITMAYAIITMFMLAGTLSAVMMMTRSIEANVAARMKNSETAPTGAPEAFIDLSRLRQDYLTNEADAKVRYSGKTLHITGNIMDIPVKQREGIRIQLSGDDPQDEAYAWIDGPLPGRWTPGRTIEITCRGIAAQDSVIFLSSCQA